MQTNLKTEFVRLLVLLTIATSLLACGSARVGQFDRFAQAGIKFTDSVPPVLDEAFQTAVETDSLVLVESRKRLSSQDDRLNAIETSNKNLKQRILLLNDLKRHARLLRSYFLALRALARTDEASGISDVAKGLVGSLETLDKRIAAVNIGGLSVKDFVGESSSLAVAAFQSAALNRELKERASIIDHELDIMQASLRVISEAMKSDIEAQLEATNRDEIELPYVRDSALPSDWNARRLAAFKRQIKLSSIDTAVDAAENMRLSFVALVENRLDDTGIALLLQDIDRVITLTEGISGTK